MMELVHRFSVPVPVDAAWAHFNDISSVAECFPGATVTSADEQGFVGSVKVRLGPISLLYNGSGSFVEKDADARRMVIDAKGKDKRGNGTAAAHVVLTMAGAEAATEVEVSTQLSVTGKPAQFGRGVMQDVSDKLLAQFVACLEQRYADHPAAATEPEASAEPEESAEPPTPSTPAPTPEAPPAGTAAAPEALAGAAAAPDAIDLGRTVLPVLARSYGPWVLAALAVLVAVRCCRRR